MCRIPTQTYCKILLSMCMAMCMCISCNIYVALGARGLMKKCLKMVPNFSEFLFYFHDCMLNILNNFCITTTGVEL